MCETARRASIIASTFRRRCVSSCSLRRGLSGFLRGAATAASPALVVRCTRICAGRPTSSSAPDGSRRARWRRRTRCVRLRRCARTGGAGWRQRSSYSCMTRSTLRSRCFTAWPTSLCRLGVGDAVSAALPSLRVPPRVGTLRRAARRLGLHHGAQRAMGSRRRRPRPAVPRRPSLCAAVRGARGARRPAVADACVSSF